MRVLLSEDPTNERYLAKLSWPTSATTRRKGLSFRVATQVSRKTWIGLAFRVSASGWTSTDQDQSPKVPVRVLGLVSSFSSPWFPARTFSNQAMVSVMPASAA